MCEQRKARGDMGQEKIRQPDLSVIILNWNTRELLRESLQSLLSPPPALDVQIIVADNNSSDGSRDMVKALFPGVTLVANPDNIGFGAGNNRAVPFAEGRYVLFLNSDTRVMEGALQTLVDYADANPDVGILGPKLLNADGSLQYSCRRYPNLTTGFFRNTPLGRLFPRNRFAADYLMKDWDHATPRDVDWISGAALMMRRALLEQIGAFDEDFYMYCEDVDLCWRANHAQYKEGEKGRGGEGEKETAAKASSSASSIINPHSSISLSSIPPALPWRVTYLPNAVIYHYIGKSSDLVPTRMTYEFHRSQYLFYKKHYAARTPLLVRPIILPGIILRALGQILLYRARYWRRKLTARLKRHAARDAAASRSGDAS